MTATANLSPRQRRLWDMLRNRPAITTGDIHTANRQMGAPKRTTARADLEALIQAGLLIGRGPKNARWFEPVAVSAP